MFGYIAPQHDTLAPEALARYRSLYCGLCHALGNRHGLKGRLTLTYDLTFLACVLSSLYEPKEDIKQSRCMVHPAKKSPYVQSDVVRYAADMNLALCYHKLLDDWNDDKNIAARTAAKALEKSYGKVSLTSPTQCESIEKNLARITQAEKITPFQVDDAVNAFADLMGTLFLYRDDRWGELLYQMGAALGRFIYMMDAFDDCKRDAKKHLPNPFSPDVDEEKVRQLLTILLGECAMALEALPLEQDLEILRNILYSGVWTRYQLRVAKNNKESEKKTPRTSHD